MSKIPKAIPQHLYSIITEVFRIIVVQNGGEVLQTQVTQEGRVVQYEAVFGEEASGGRYHIFLTMVWNGSNYEVERFNSLELVKHAEVIYFQAANVILRELGDRKWQLTASKGLIALFKAHTRWSELYGMKPIFTALPS